MPSPPAAGPTGRRPAARPRSAIYRRLSAPPLDDAVPWAERPRLVGRRPVRAARPPALERQGRSTTSCSASALARRAPPAADRPGVPLPVDHVHPFPTGEAIGEARGAAWCAATLADELRAAGPRRERRLAGVRPRVPRDRAGRPPAVGLPGLAGARLARLALAIPAPTHIEPHVERVTLNPAVARRRAGRAGRGVRATDKAAGLAESSARSATRAAGPASSPGARARPGSSTRLPRPPLPR